MTWEVFHPIDIDTIFVGLLVSFSLITGISVYQKYKCMRAKASTEA